MLNVLLVEDDLDLEEELDLLDTEDLEAELEEEHLQFLLP